MSDAFHYFALEIPARAMPKIHACSLMRKRRLARGCAARFHRADVQWIADDVLIRRIESDARQLFGIARQQRRERRKSGDAGRAQLARSPSIGDRSSRNAARTVCERLRDWW